MKFVHRIAAAGAFPHGGRKKFTVGGGGSGGSGGSPYPWLNSTGTPSAGPFSFWGFSVYTFPAERIKGDRCLLEQISPDNTWTRMMRSKFKIVSREGSEVSIAAQAAVVLLLLGFAVYIRSMGVITNGSKR